MSATTDLLKKSLAAADDFMTSAHETDNAKQAADWALAAKNSVSVALSSVQTEATLNKAVRESKERTGRRGY